MTINPPIPPGAAEPEQELCRSYLAYQRSHPKLPLADGAWPPPGPAITVSTQMGAGANEMAKRLAALLQKWEPGGNAPWTVFNRQLLEQVLEEHHLPKRLSQLMTEDRRSYFDDVADEFMGLRPPSWDMIPKIIQSVRHLVDMGHVILVGRGASSITSGMINVFHVRLIGSMERRIERVQKRESLSASEAARLITKTDRGLARYLKAHFHTNIDDNLQYDLVINTDHIPLSDTAELIVDGATRRFHSSPEGHDRIIRKARSV
jgi:cytidylate kinase